MEVYFVLGTFLKIKHTSSQNLGLTIALIYIGPNLLI